MRLDELAGKLGAVLEGDGSVDVTGLAALKDAGPADVSFLANPRYAADMASTQAGAVLVNSDWTGACPGALLRVPNPDQAFAAAGVVL